MIQIILDSNIIRSNWYLSGASMTVIEKLIKLNVCKLVVPDIVILEVNNLFRKEVTKAIREVNSLKTILTELSLPVSCPDTKEICEKYRDRLNERLDNLNVQRLTYSSIPQDKIVARAISYRRPFQEGGKGYKDAIIWENILSVAGSDDETYLITNDLNDFSDKSKDKKLHPDLVKDLEDMGKSVESVKLCTSIKEFVDTLISQYLEQVEAMEQLKEGKYKSFSINEWFVENSEDIITSLSDDADSVISMYHELEDPTVDYIERPDSITVEDIYKLEDDTVYMDAIACADVIFSVFIYKPDYYVIEDDYPIDVQDFNWSEHYVWATMTLHLPIKFSLVFNIVNEQVEEFEVNGFEETFGWCKSCGAAITSDAAESCSKCGKDFF